VPLYNLMEDAATAEISRAQLWQWLRHGVRLADGRVLDLALFNALLGEELERIHREIGRDALAGRVFPTATRLFTHMVTAPEFDDFLTLPAYDLLA
jgi:malate synthase